MKMDSEPYENCIYINSTKPKIIFDTYEGIPQNLILSFCVWLSLLTIFTILRKNAGNYGRIALVQRPDDSLRWTELFYGSVDDVPGSSQTETSSTDSVSYYHDKGVFSWISAIFRIRMDDIEQKCGTNAKQYLSFQRHIICFMLIMTLTSICIVLPVNFQGALEGDESNFGHTTINNLDPESNLLWTHVIIGLLYLPLAIFFMRRFSVEAKIQEKKVTESVSVMILNIPRHSCDSADLHRHFREAYPELVVKEIQLAFDITGVSRLDKEREKVYQARQYCEDYHRRTRERLQMRPFYCGYICGCCNGSGCSKVDAIEFYQAEEERLLDAMDAARTTALKRPLGIAFVTFETVDDSKSFMLDFRTGCFCGGNLNSSSLSHQLKPQWWQVSYAPPRSDIIWENLSMPLKYWYLRAILINTLLFIFLFFLTTPAYVINLISTTPIKDSIAKKVNPFLGQFIPTLMLLGVAVILPAIVSFTDRFLGHWTRSEQNHSLMVKTFILLFFMVLVLPSIGLTSAKYLVDWTWDMKNETFRWKCISMPDKGAFFINYVMTSSFVGTAFELLRLSELFYYGIRLCLARSRAELSGVQKEVLWEFPFGIQYGWMLLIFSITTMFSLFCPLITPFGLLYMLLKHAVDKHNLYFAYSPSKIGPEIHATALNCVIFSVVLVQVSFFALSYLRTGFSAITIVALLGFTVTITFFIFIVFFSCCKGFNPISYERKYASSHTSPARGGDSRWFVPDVLNVQNVGPQGDEDVVRTYGTQDEPTRVLLHVNQALYQEDSAGV